METAGLGDNGRELFALVASSERPLADTEGSEEIQIRRAAGKLFGFTGA